MASFLGPSDQPGFLGSPYWRELAAFWKGETDRAGADAWDFGLAPNPGTLYPALRELGERVLGASKATRPFQQVREEGYRCTVCGEREWLRGVGDNQPPPWEEGKSRPRRRYELPKGPVRGETLWTKLAQSPEGAALIKSGEHLCALCATKRLWPRRFAELASGWLKEEGKVSRFVVSTHTMALAPDLAQLPLRRRGGEKEEEFLRRHEALRRLGELAAKSNLWAPLPKKLADELEQRDEETKRLCRAAPLLFDRAREREEGEEGKAEDAQHVRLSELDRLWRQAFGHRPETYYALLMMDGDGMGRWLSGDPAVMLALKDVWHPTLVSALERRFPHRDHPRRRLLQAPRPASPAYHVALSGAMNAFSQEVARWVVEELYYGRLIYAGGDDVLAMVAVDDLLPCMLTLRCAFSGIVPAGERDSVFELYRQLGDKLGAIDRGYVRMGKHLRRLLGGRVTASMGAVVAHHQAPLQAALRRLRQAEKLAKGNGRNSFTIVVVKRGGGETSYTASWGFGGPPGGETNGGGRDLAYEPQKWAAQSAQLVSPMGVLFRLRETLALPFVSRRAAYRALEWLVDLPCDPKAAKVDPEAYKEMLKKSLAWQFRRQGLTREKFQKSGYAQLLPAEGDPAHELATAMVEVAMRQCAPPAGRDWRPVSEHLSQMLWVAEFLAREGRAPQLPHGSAAAKGGEA